MLHEIFKGMDNASEKINENFEEIETGLIEDITEQFNIKPGIPEFIAYKIGKIIIIKYTHKPSSTWEHIADSDTIELLTSFQGSVNKSGKSDNEKDYGVQINSVGTITARASSTNWVGNASGTIVGILV